MATSDNFFLSRKNLVGMLIAATILVIHLVLGLGFLWPVVALAGWGAGVALTPGPRQKALEPAPQQVDAESLLRDLDGAARRLYAAGPAPQVLDAMAQLRGTLVDVLTEWDRLVDVPEQKVVVESMITRYVPDTISGYLEVSDRRHPTAVTVTTASLTILQEEAANIREAAVNDTLRELEDQTRALRIQFGRLPGPGYDTES